MASLSLTRLANCLRQPLRSARYTTISSSRPRQLSGVPVTLTRNLSTSTATQALDELISETSNTTKTEVPSSNGNGANDVNGTSLGETATDWSKSYHGLATHAFPKEVTDVLLAPINPDDIEMKPDGLIYLPEIKYRRALNKAFGPGAWGLAPRSDTNVGPKIVSREYALVCQGRLVAIARGEQEYFDPSGIPTATEACKSNALMRCCKDLGIASELWDPRFIREFKTKYCVEVFAEHLPTKKKKKLWRRKDQGKFNYPYQE